MGGGGKASAHISAQICGQFFFVFEVLEAYMDFKFSKKDSHFKIKKQT